MFHWTRSVDIISTPNKGDQIEYIVERKTAMIYRVQSQRPSNIRFQTPTKSETLDDVNGRWCVCVPDGSGSVP